MKKGPLSWSRETCYFSRAGETHVPVFSRGSHTPVAHDEVPPRRENIMSSIRYPLAIIFCSWIFYCGCGSQRMVRVLNNQVEIMYCLPVGRDLLCLPVRRDCNSLPGGRNLLCLPVSRELYCLPVGRDLLCLPVRRDLLCLEKFLGKAGDPFWRNRFPGCGTMVGGAGFPYHSATGWVLVFSLAMSPFHKIFHLPLLRGFYPQNWVFVQKQVSVSPGRERFWGGRHRFGPPKRHLGNV